MDGQKSLWENLLGYWAETSLQLIRDSQDMRFSSVLNMQATQHRS